MMMINIFNHDNKCKFAYNSLHFWSILTSSLLAENKLSLSLSSWKKVITLYDFCPSTPQSCGARRLLRVRRREISLSKLTGDVYGYFCSLSSDHAGCTFSFQGESYASSEENIKIKLLLDGVRR